MKEFPLVKITIVFITGILLEKYIQIGYLFYLGTFLFCFILYLIQYKYVFKSWTKIALILSVYICIALTGTLITQKENSYKHYIPTKFDRVKNLTVFGKIKSVDLKNSDYFRFELETDSLTTNQKRIYFKTNLLCSISTREKLKTDSLYSLIQPGNFITMRGTYEKGRGERNPGEFDYNKYLHSENISGTFKVYTAKQIIAIKQNPNLFKNYIFQIRKNIKNRIDELHNKETAALLRGLLLADRSGISYDVKTNFINAGVVHVLAVSGLHVGYILIVFLLLFGRLNIYLKSILTVLGLILFVLITGMHASVVRASIMAVIIIIALLTNRSTNLINSISFAALLILIFKPNDVFTPGFQLSFSAVLSIAIIYPMLEKWIKQKQIENNFLKYVLLFSAISLSAQIGTLPFTLHYFGKLSLIALFANLIVIPLIGFIVGNAIVTIIISVVFQPLAVLYANANNLMTHLLVAFVNWSGQIKYSFVWVNHFTILDSLAFYSVLIFWFYFNRKIVHTRIKIILPFLLVVNFIAFYSIVNKKLLPNNRLSVVMIDVGQGDSFLINFPDGKNALIDAGNRTIYFDNGKRVIEPLLSYLGIKEINTAYVSHIDADHYGGFISLLSDGLVKHVYKPFVDSSYVKDVNFEKLIKKVKTPIKYYQHEIIREGKTRIYILNNLHQKSELGTTTNNRSGVLKIVYGNTSFIFTGDIEKKAEEYYTSKYGPFLKSTVLKVAHHGSKTSSCRDFLEEVKPKISLVSVGLHNRFHHPSKVVINRLQNDSSKVLRTDKQGAVILVSNGNKIKTINWHEME